MFRLSIDHRVTAGDGSPLFSPYARAVENYMEHPSPPVTFGDCEGLAAVDSYRIAFWVGVGHG